MGRELARQRQEWVAKRQVRYQEIDTALKRHVGLTGELRPKMVEDNDTFVEW